jgi:hypothetical protein
MTPNQRRWHVPGIARFGAPQFKPSDAMSSPSIQGAGGPAVHATQRSDWDDLVNELYTGVIAGCPFGIGLATKQKGLLGASIRLRLNQNFPSPAITSFVKRNFRVANLDQIFQSDQGLEHDARNNTLKITGESMGLPRNSLVYRIANPKDAILRALLIFGGERLEGQLERRLQAAATILEKTAAERGGLPPLDTPEQMEAALAKINVKRLFDYDMDMLARMVNGLEEHKEDLPKHLKPLFKSVSDYIIKKRVRR